nr:putative peptidase [Quercus suber]
MCGRYVLHLRPSEVRRRLADQHMPSEEAPSDDDRQVRQSYNFAPGQHGLIYRADTSDYGFGDRNGESREDGDDGEREAKRVKHSHADTSNRSMDGMATKETKYKLQCAKWGLIPNWTRRAPDYANQMRTINCRDDSLLENRGLWNTMKARKRCIVVAEGFFEWLKKNNGKERVPHYVKRKDGQLMCFAGLWDVCTFENTGDKVGKEGNGEKVYSYTIITTDSNQQLKFLHDRMPVIFEAGSPEMKSWLDPERVGWNAELQKTLKPFQGELECYVVDKAVGKVGNDKPTFVVPIDSSENKNNIANFFAKSPAKVKKEEKTERETANGDTASGKLDTSNVEDPESNAPLPKPKHQPENEFERALQEPRISSSSIQSSTSTLQDIHDAKGWNDDDDNECIYIKDEELSAVADRFVDDGIKREVDNVGDEALYEASMSPPRKLVKVPGISTRTTPSTKTEPASAERDRVKEEKIDAAEENNGIAQPSTPTRAAPRVSEGKMRSAVSNNTAPPKTPSKTPKDAKITSFFGGKS